MSCSVTKVGGVEFCMTRHAAQRAIDLCLTVDDILEILRNPVDSFISTKYGSLTVRNDEIALPLPSCERSGGAHRCLITVLPYGAENWERLTELGILTEDRTYDPKRYSRRIT